MTRLDPTTGFPIAGAAAGRPACQRMRGSICVLVGVLATAAASSPSEGYVPAVPVRCVPHPPTGLKGNQIGEDGRLHPGHCIKETHQHLPGWHVFHVGGGAEYVCPTQDANGKCLSTPQLNPRNHYSCKIFEPMFGKKGYCGNPALKGHPTRDLDKTGKCEC